MEDKKKCSFKEHQNIDAIKYCTECKIYMCNKCLIHHQNLFENHNQYEINKDLLEIFIDKCEEKNHPNKLEFYCITHNKLCCASCITKLEGKGYGQHKDCNIDFIENIKEEKKNKLKDNIKYLENISNNLNNTINELKILFEKINENKEQLKLKIQKIFTNFRNVINEKEDELLLEVDKIYEKEYCNDNIIRDGEKLPNKLNALLEKSKKINDDWEDINKLNYLINMCINLEKSIESINIINDNINKCKLSKNKKIELIVNNELSDTIIKNIKEFCKINIFNEPDLNVKGNGMMAVIMAKRREMKEREVKNNRAGLINKIIQNDNEANEFSNFIFNDQNYKYKLLYQATKDGDKISDILKKIDGQSPTLFLIHTKKGIKCGGYTKALWKADSKYKYDETSFLFNFSGKKIFKNKNPNEAIVCYDNHCMVFGNFKHSDYYIRNNFLTDKIYEALSKYSYNSNGYDVQGENDANINELEIYLCYK